MMRRGLVTVFAVVMFMAGSANVKAAQDSDVVDVATETVVEVASVEVTLTEGMVSGGDIVANVLYTVAPEPDVQEVQKSVDSEGNLIITADYTLAEDMRITGNLVVSSGKLDLNGHTLTVAGTVDINGGSVDVNGGKLDAAGDFNIGTMGEMSGFSREATSTGKLVMDDEGDEVWVGGDFVICSETMSILQGGTMYIGGDFAQYGTYYLTAGFAKPGNFYGKESHLVVFSDNTPHSIYFDSTSSGFGKVDFGNGEIEFLSAVRGFSLYEDVEWTLKSGATSAGFDGTLDLAGHQLTINGDMNLSSGAVDVNSGCLEVKGNLSIGIKGEYESGRKASSTGILVMDDEGDEVYVDGNFAICSENVSTLTKGTMYIGGDFAQYGSNYLVAGYARPGNFSPGESHLVVFSDNAPHSIYFESTKSGFGKVDFGNGELEFKSAIRGIALYEDVEWNLKSTTTSLGIDGILDLAGHKLTINGNPNLTSGTIDINAGCLKVNGNLSFGTKGEMSGSSRYATSTGKLVMDDEEDEVYVGGDFALCSESLCTLTNGVMYIAGDFAQYGTNHLTSGFAYPGNFNAGESHLVVFEDSTPHSIYFDSASSGFGKVDFGNGEIELLGNIRGMALYEDMEWNLKDTDNSISIGGTLDLAGHKLTIKGDINLLSGTVDINEGCLEVKGTFSIGTAGTLHGYLRDATSTGKLIMDGENDTVVVNGDFGICSGSVCTLKAGTMYLAGDFTQYGRLFLVGGNARTDSFVASENHKVVLCGKEKQSVLFEGSASHFGTLVCMKPLSNSNYSFKPAECWVTYVDGTPIMVKEFVERMYTVALGRASDPSGVEYWAEQLISKEDDGASLSRGFLLGDEFVGKNYTNSQYIQVLYKTFFDREADEQGGAYWASVLDSGSSRASVLAGFVNSNEFFELCRDYGISRGILRSDGTSVNPGIYQFAERLYSKILERDGDMGGIEYWTMALDSRVCSPENAAISFFFSPEYEEMDTTNEEYIKALYRTFMGREADADGLAHWKSAMNNGTSRQEVLSSFAHSDEFKGIMEEYGL